MSDYTINTSNFIATCLEGGTGCLVVSPMDLFMRRWCTGQHMGFQTPWTRFDSSATCEHLATSRKT